MTVKAKESQHILKARKKIEEKLKSADKRMNPEALGAMSRLIKEQLNRQQPDRINLKKRNVKDDSDRFAKTESKFVLKMISQIKHDKLKPVNKLAGRIKSLPESNQPAGNKHHVK